MFDIDGTLIQSCEYDEECFVKAIETALGISQINKDWGVYRNVTDTGILQEITNEHWGRDPTEKETRTVQEHFLAHLKEVLARERHSIQPIPF